VVWCGVVWCMKRENRIGRVYKCECVEIEGFKFNVNANKQGDCTGSSAAHV